MPVRHGAPPTKNGQWYFDVQEGRTEIRNRTIGGNELDAIEACRGFVEAQQMYAEMDGQGDGVPEYAKRIVSSTGKKDGLYWPGEDSPLSERFARAVAEGYQRPTTTGQAYHGYITTRSSTPKDLPPRTAHRTTSFAI